MPDWNKVASLSGEFEVAMSRLMFHLTALAVAAGPIVASLTGCDSTTASRSAALAPVSSSQASDSESTGQPASDASVHRSGHERMLATLREIKRRARDEDPFTAEKPLRDRAAHLASLPASASESARNEALVAVGDAALDLGQTEKAIEHYNLSLRMIEESARPQPTLARAWAYFRLGVAYLRLGETQNCCLSHNPESCIMPIQGGGIHSRQDGSRQAMRCFKQVAALTPADTPLHLRARWLLNIAAMTVGEYPDGIDAELRLSPDLFDSDVEFPRFPNVAQAWKVDRFNSAGGAVADDFDGDGHLDLATSSMDPAEEMRLYLNRGGAKFDDCTSRAGLAGMYGGLNLVHADYDNDGFLDLYVIRGGWMSVFGAQPNSLLRNLGDGTFMDVSHEAGLAGPDRDFPSQTAAWADYDNDGDLDLYVGNESEPGGRSGGGTAPCQLFRGNGDGSFTNVAGDAGVMNVAFAKGVAWGDFDHDRWPDLYVSNLNGANRLYHNNGAGRFRDVAAERGVTRPIHSFPAWFWDVDNNGALDLFVAAYSAKTDALAASYLGLPFPHDLPCLYLGDGRGNFTEAAARYDLARPHLVMGSNFGDLNNDGFLDCYFGTGDPAYENLLPNAMYLNLAGQKFADVTTAGGFGHLQKGHGVAFADFDNDGDQDVFEEMGGALPGDKFANCLYENPGFGNRFVKVRVVGRESNRAAFGVRLHVKLTEGGQQRSIYRHIGYGSSFGGNPLVQHVGIGQAEKIDALEVFWPTTGQTQTFADVPADATVRVIEGVPSLVMER
jgi:tetratricopeptide (TPR) repeat protein